MPILRALFDPCRRIFRPRLATTTALAAALLSLPALFTAFAQPAARTDAAAKGHWIWIEGEQPAKASVTRHSWYSAVDRGKLSGGDLLSHWSAAAPGVAEYSFTALAAGEYEFWLRANPVQSRLAYQLNDGPWTPIDAGREQVGNTNIAADDKPDLRFVAWSRPGDVNLRAGANTIRFRLDSPNNNHGAIDCFLFTAVPFQPQGILKPEEVEAANRKALAEAGEFVPFNPGRDTFAESPIDLRFLNESFAGENGFIAAEGHRFIHSSTKQPVRFWAVNGPPSDMTDPAELRRCARMLAKRGVNLVRVHGGYYDESGNLRPEKIKRAHAVVAAMKAEGIYTHFSIYFPLWMQPKENTPWLAGYDGKQHPFAALYFNPDFQAQYRRWWNALLTTPGPDGKKLVDEPAVMGVELVNEDSYFFWTFTDKNLPEPQLRMLEKQFGDWAAKRYGSIEAALKSWSQKLPRDNPAEGRLAFRPLWNIFNEKRARDKETAAFLLESQRDFYAETNKYLRDLGFRGLITASNWHTASPQIFGPLEKYTYTAADFIDRHGYFGGVHRGDNAAWSIREGHLYSDRSALRFDGETPKSPRSFVHPVMDPTYADKPSMISETTFTRPNRYRTEAPLYYAAFGALQDTDAIVHFALDGPTWSVRPGFFVQPWTLMAPSQAGQFPAAALLYRKSLVEAGPVLLSLNLNLTDLQNLAGTPLPQEAAFDELRLADIPPGQAIRQDSPMDPLIHYAGRVEVKFTDQPFSAKRADLSKLIDRKARTVTSATGQLHLDYASGLLVINAPSAQGLSGNLAAAAGHPAARLDDLAISTDQDLAHIIAVSLDDQPLKSSRRMLLQVMTEEKPSGFKTESTPDGLHRITALGQDPWTIRRIRGSVRLTRPDAAELTITPLDPNGYPLEKGITGPQISLRPDVIYYLITR